MHCYSCAQYGVNYLVVNLPVLVINLRVCVYVYVLCMTLLRVLMLTVGHDNTSKCMCVLCMTLFRILILTVGHDSLMCACMCVCVWGNTM